MRAPLPKKLLAEMAMILLAAATVGIAWNHRLLVNAWTGGIPAEAGSGGAQERTRIPLPLGLMQVKELYDRNEATFVDARDATSFATRHIRGAVSFPVGEFATRLPQFRALAAQTTTLLVYCNGYDCHDSRELGTRLLENGYRTVYVFEGGFPEWRDAGYPTAGGKR